jgi:tRNA (guanine-N7-)-methyltransferase
VQYLLPPESVSVVHLLFPDPWPKKRHQRRRLVSADFLAAVHRSLAPGGLFRIATDQEDYFAAIQALATTSPFAEEIGAELEIFPLTTFEKHFVAARVPVHRLRLRKIS